MRWGIGGETEADGLPFRRRRPRAWLTGLLARGGRPRHRRFELSSPRRGRAHPPITAAARALGSRPLYTPYGRSGLMRQPVAVAAAARARSARQSQPTPTTAGHRRAAARTCCAHSARQSPTRRHHRHTRPSHPLVTAAAYAPAGRCRHRSCQCH